MSPMSLNQEGDNKAITLVESQPVPTAWNCHHSLLTPGFKQLQRILIILMVLNFRCETRGEVFGFTLVKSFGIACLQ